MNYTLLEQAEAKFFTVQKIAETLDISEPSARVLASRYTAKKLLLSPKKNFYFLAAKAAKLTVADAFYLSSLFQTPSYISFQTALSYYEISTQMPREFIEAVNPLRSCSYNLAGMEFSYVKIKKNLYFGFERKENFFIATPEKALLDSCYMEVFKKYSTDWSSLDFSKFDQKELKKMAKKFPPQVQNFAGKLFKIYG